MSARRPGILPVFLLAAGVLSAGGCSILEQGADLLGDAGKAASQGEKAVKVAQSLRSAFGDFTEEEEYYIGRSVAALVLSRYPALNLPALNKYLNVLGNAVALHSDRPEIYAGWHFLVLDTEEVNALAAPGGMIFVSKGLLRRCKDEESLGMILAHEIGHVTAKHGLQSIQKAKLAEAFATIGTEAVKAYGPAQLAKVTAAFEDVLSDIVEKLIERGYDRSFEYQADELSVRFGSAIGYDPSGLTRFLQTMVGDKSAVSGAGWFKTHPTPEQRIDRAKKTIGSLKRVPAAESVRTQRFKAAMAGLK